MSDPVIKSVGRVFEILELFNQRRSPLTAKQIAELLNYPLNSAHALLKSMRKLGYMEFYEEEWSYLPSAKFSHTLDWVDEYFERDSNIIHFMEDLNEETMETINLSRVLNNKTKFIQGLESIHPIGISVRIGLTMPAAQSLTGITSLARFSEEQLAAFLEQPGNANADEKLIREILEEIESSGTTCKTDLFVKGIGAVCLPIISHGENILVVGVVGPSERILENKQVYRKAIKRLASKHKIKTLFKLKSNKKVVPR